MKLYFAPGACSFAVHIVLQELGLPYELVKTDVYTKKLSDGGNFLAVSPNGFVPVLELDDGKRIFEVQAIAQYLADLKPEINLAPKNGTFPRYQMQEWLNFASAEIHRNMAPLFFPQVPEDYKKIARQNAIKRYEFANAALEGKTYLVGEQFSCADALLYVTITWCQYLGINMDAWKNLTAYVERISARPSVKAAREAEAAAK